MLSIRSSADLAHAFDGPMDPELKSLLTLRRDQWLADDDLDLGELVHIIVVSGPGVTLEGVEEAAGVPLATNLVDGSRLGEPDFVTSFEFVERHGAWIEAVLILSDDGFGVALFVPDRDDVDPRLLQLLRAHA